MLFYKKTTLGECTCIYNLSIYNVACLIQERDHFTAFSAIVAAGLDGIKKKIDPGDPTGENIYKMSNLKKQFRNKVSSRQLRRITEGIGE